MFSRHTVPSKGKSFRPQVGAVMIREGFLQGFLQRVPFKGFERVNSRGLY